ncbi:hypothetical protein FW778_09325 [Ginsengibacter hankyongi]|uniref:Uncharacterized protein n=1 Tax=Ginsengibacter hankyongi TaxID=2607284 RepID=A0A5J5IQ93_9BACT|nr:hypothetical protein [Ginsengibacter hankyongi]KAA9042194.1 hypothetical protein FW778_09325 [Ginsengibacter hankyongi]
MTNEEIATNKLEQIANVSDLNAAIKRLERKKFLLEENLKDDFHSVLESLKPANILKHTLHEVQESTELKHNLFKVALGLGAGYFSRKLVVGKSAGILKKALGTALQYGITNFISKRNDKDDEIGFRPKRKNLFKRILSI